MVCHKAGGGTERPRAYRWLITAPSPDHDEVDTLPGCGIADGAARLAPELHRLNAAGQSTGQLLSFDQGIGTTLELGVDQFALAMRRQPLSTRTVPYQIEASARIRPLNVDQQELHFVKAQKARQ